MRRSICHFLLLSIVASTALARAGEWPSLRGPRSDGSTNRSGGTFAESTTLELAWKRAIGPGYSGVTVAAGRAVTAFSDGTNDVVAAWSTSDGRELWRTTIGRTYRGHDGSTDGPVGTATLTDERVYFVGPHGDLLALSVDRGEILWKKSLKSEWSAREPTYGFATIPIEVDGVLVVPAGAEKHSILGLDPQDGRWIWSVGADRIEYSTPVLVPSGKTRTVVVAGSQDLVGLDPREGRILWSHRHSEAPSYDPTYPQLQPVGERFLLTFQAEAVLYEVAAGPDGVRLTELWRSAAFKNSVAIPVAVGNYLYGFNGTFLTCVDIANGEAVWKSRTPRGRGLILLDDQLVILGSGGVLTLVKADPAGYRETASLVLFDHGGYTAPSFADGRIYVRNRDEIASVALGTSGAALRTRHAPGWAGSGDFAKWMRRIEQAQEPAKLVEEFLAAQVSFPVVDEEWVHFVYAGPAEAVAVVGQMNDGELGEPMTRVGRADLFVRSYPVVSGGRWQYRFQVDFADPQVDSRNPNRGSGGFDETSEVLFEGFADPAFVTETAAVTGRLETVKLQSKAYGSEIEVRLYLPADFDPQVRYPLVVMPNGQQWIDGGIVGVLDNVFEMQMRSALVALVPISDWVGGSWGERAVTLLGEELLPAIQSAYRIAESAERRALWTVEDKAAVGMILAVETPGVFGRFAFQSPKLYFRGAPDLGSLSGKPTAFHISWSRYEPRSRETGTHEGAEAKRLFEHIRGAGLPVEGGEFVAGPGYRTWRTEADTILAFLLGSGDPRPGAAPD